MKIKALLLVVVFTALFVGCSPADTVTSASITDNSDVFEKAISAEGTWIICLIDDMTFDKELVLDGKFLNGKKDDKGNDIVQRKIALYSSDNNKNKIASFTLTAPKLTVNSENAILQGGTFVGDVYVNANGFNLVDQKVEGNIYFSSEEYKESYVMDDKSSVTGSIEVK